MAKGKSLLNQVSSKKSKKENKYSEVSSIKTEYKFSLQDKVVYVGLLEEFRDLVCTIIKRSRRKITDYYKVKFDDGEELDSISGVFLKTIEEYELEVEQLENNDSDNENSSNDMSEFEMELNRQGKTSYQNYVACLSPIYYYQMSCVECNFHNRCVYKNKGDYKKLKFN